MSVKPKAWALALLAMVLLLGGAAGALVDRTLAGEPACVAREARSDSHRRTAYLDRLTEELQLSGEQRAQVQSIVDRHRESMSALWHEMRPRFEAMKTELRSEVKDVLSAEQRAEYEELIRNEPGHWRRGGKANR